MKHTVESIVKQISHSEKNDYRKESMRYSKVKPSSSRQKNSKRKLKQLQTMLSSGGRVDRGHSLQKS